MTLLALGLLVTVVVAGTSLIGSERRVNDNATSQTDAFAMAQTGLDRFLVNRAAYGFTASPPAAQESTRVTVSGGYVDVVLQRVRPQVSTQPAVYVLRSTGVRTIGGYPGVPPARRTVAQLVRWNSGSMRPSAAWTSLTGLHKNGGSGTISGVNHCGTPVDTVGGVSVPVPPGYTQNGGSSVPSGSPNIDTLGTSYTAAAAQVPIDWQGIRYGGAVTPNYTIPGATWNNSWFSSAWPIIRVNNDGGASFALPGDGRGVLIVTGDMSISGNTRWDGVILVGRTLTSNGNNTVYGAVITGLNVLTSSNPDSMAAAIGNADMGNGNKTFQYDACAISSSLSGFAGLETIPNAWTDEWATY
jgi:hypothetical protein